MLELEAAVQAWRAVLGWRDALTAEALDELEDHLRADFANHVAAGLSPSDAFAAARDGLGHPVVLATEFEKVEPTGWRRVVMAGWVLFAASFLLPVHAYGITLFGATIADGMLPGVQAFVLALQGEAGVVGIVSALTNALVLVSLWSLSRRARGPMIPLVAMILVAVLLNGWWLFMDDPINDLRMGYYVWWASFAVVGTGLAIRARSKRRAPSPLCVE